MLHIKLFFIEFNYLLESNLSKSLKEILEKQHERNFENVHLKIEKNIAEDILNFLENDFILKGLKKDDEPNEHGLFIENIIGKFSNEIYN